MGSRTRQNLLVARTSYTNHPKAHFTDHESLKISNCCLLFVLSTFLWSVRATEHACVRAFEEITNYVRILLVVAETGSLQRSYTLEYHRASK